MDKPTGEAHSRSPLHVLVVENETIERALVTKILIRDGHTVETASDGQEGWDKFQAGRFDVVVADRTMPEMNGDQLAAAIKQIAPTMPIIMVTGYGVMIKAAGKCSDGVDLIVSKPVTPTELRQALAQVP